MIKASKKLFKATSRRATLSGSLKKFFSEAEDYSELLNMEREVIDYDVVIIGGGPSGLATAIKLKQLEEAKGNDIEVCLVEKGSEVGSHILSGNCFEPSSFGRLFPDWEKMDEFDRPPLEQKVTHDEFTLLFGEELAFNVPHFLYPKTINNHGNYIISLGELCSWMAEQAEDLGVDIFTGFAADELLMDKENNYITGIATVDVGLNKEGIPKDTFMRGIEIRAKQTVLAEGCRGSLTERVIQKFDLHGDVAPQIYGIGLKEVWEVPEEHLTPGLVKHTTGWPLSSGVLMTNSTYGGSFMYHMAPNLIHLGFVVGLDYKNPYLNPYEEFQRWKSHKEVRQYLEGGTCIKYGARALNEGAYFSVPELAFPGGLVVGCGAGFLNVAKVKGAHNAIESGIEAAEALYYKLNYDDCPPGTIISEYTEKVKKGPIMDELYETRNFHGGFKYGNWIGLGLGWLSDKLGGKEPWNLAHTKKDCTATGMKEDFRVSLFN